MNRLSYMLQYSGYWHSHTMQPHSQPDNLLDIQTPDKEILDTKIPHKKQAGIYVDSSLSDRLLHIQLHSAHSHTAHQPGILNQ